MPDDRAACEVPTHHPRLLDERRVWRLLPIHASAARTTVAESPSMRCPHCEADTPNGARFCIECGTPLRARWPQCGAGVLPRAKFRAECGTPLMAQSPAPPFAPPYMPLRYPPGYLMEVVHRYEGTVNQVMGDDIMALFGAPVVQQPPESSH
jgi:Double zinc ribbon